MKSRILFIIAFVAISLGVTAQTPYAFNYQSVVRDASGQLLVNQSVGIQISLRQGSATGTISYQESFTMTSNDYALVNLRVGEGTVGFGVFDAIDWGNGPYFMEVSMDFAGGNNYLIMGSSQLVSVPYALHAKTADNTFSGDYTDLSNTPTNISFFTNDAGYVITELDGDSTNEIQALTLSNDTIFLSNGGFVKLPAPIFGFNGQYSGLIGAPVNVSHFTNDAGYITSELDGDSTNEIQTLSLSNDTMYLSNGGNADLSGYDNTAAINVNTAAITGNTSNITTNTGNISTNSTGITTNGTAISTNATGISTNASGIVTNASGISTNGTAIAGNTSNITTNTGNISTNTTGIATNGTAISTNATGVSTNASGIVTNASGISANSTAIAGNTTSITTNTGNITTNATGIATNGTAITTNATGISTNASGISANGTAIAGNTTNITTNTGNISTNTTGIATNGTAIITNATGISTNTTGIATNATSISTHITNDLDTDSTNEIQSLSLSGTTLSLSLSNAIDLQDASVWDTNTVGAYYGENVGIGGAPLSNKALTIHTDSMNTGGLIQYSRSNYFNFIEFQDRDNGKRISVGMADTGYAQSAFTIGLNSGSGFTDPLIIEHGAPTNSIRVKGNGNVGFGVFNAEYPIHASGDSMVITGYSTGQHADNWRNVGVYGETQTDDNPGRGVSGHVYGTNYGIAVRGEAATDAENQGVSGIALSKPGNTINQFGVYGEARKEWSATSTGTGVHWGGYFLSTGEGAFTVGATGYATTPGTGSNRGLSGTANSNTASDNFGVISFASGSISGTNRGAYGQASNSTGTNYGVQGAAYGAGTNQTGVYGYSNGTNGNNYGVDGTTEGTGAQNVGTGGFAYGTNTGSNKNYGMYAYAQNADTNYGVFSTVTGADNVNYGMYGEATGGTLANYGVYGKTSATMSNSFGVYGLSDGVSSNDNTGIRGQASGSTSQNTGIFGYAVGSASYAVGVNGQAFNSGTTNYGVFGFSTGSTTNHAGYFVGNVTITGNLNVTGSISKGSGTFKIDHPLDPENKYLVHSFVESPEMMNVYSGNITTDANGFATVDLPTYFEAANKDFRYQLTVMGSFAQAIIKDKIAGNKFVIQTNNPNIEVSWQVTGVRSDKYADAHRVVPELEKTKKGTYLHPELYGATKEQSENAEANKLIHNPDTDEAQTRTNPGIENMEEFLEAKKKTNEVKTTPSASAKASGDTRKVESKSNQQGAEAPRAEQNQVPKESAIPAKR